MIAADFRSGPADGGGREHDRRLRDEVQLQPALQRVLSGGAVLLEAKEEEIDAGRRRYRRTEKE